VLADQCKKIDKNWLRSVTYKENRSDDESTQ
jgi:hypothetical protein